MFCPFQLSEDGYEMQFATNHLGKIIVVLKLNHFSCKGIISKLFSGSFTGHFYLANLLLDKMKETANVTGVQGRIVNLSSVAHLYTYEEGIRFDKINDESRYTNIFYNAVEN